MTSNSSLNLFFSSQVFSPRFILNVVRKFGIGDNIANGNHYSQAATTDGYIEVSRRILFDNNVDSIVETNGDSQLLYFFDCGHILRHAEVCSRAVALLNNTEFHSRFPSTMDRLRSCLAEICDQKTTTTKPSISAQMCPLCVSNNLQEVLLHVDKSVI